MENDSRSDAGGLLRELVARPGPPGQEEAVRRFVEERARALGFVTQADAKGNLLVSAAGQLVPERPRVVVTAHLDEIALLVTAVEVDGALRVAPLGGLFPWKWGEGPVEVMTTDGLGFVSGVVSFGSIHTSDGRSVAQRAREGAAPTWDDVRVVTGLSAAALRGAGVLPGCRVVMARSRRGVVGLGGGLVGSYFLDDRADLVAWLLALEALKDDGLPGDVVFAATASEEVGGEGVAYLLQPWLPDVCVALEIGPSTPENPLPLDDVPTVWVNDGYAAMAPRDVALVTEAARDAGLPPPRAQALSRGGSDASCAASRGLCARPVTLAFAADNSHGFELMHRDAPAALARLLVACLRRL